MTPEVLAKEVDQIPSMPDVAATLLHLAQDPNTPQGRIVDVLQLEPGITAQVLRLCNSAHFGLSRRITSLREALVYVGTNTLVSFVLAGFASKVMRGPRQGYGLEPGALWHHAVATALAAEVIGKATRQADLGLVFTGGLLHDVGKVVLSEHVGAEMEQILEHLAEKGGTFADAELAVLGFTHAQVGAAVARRWNLPTPLVAMIEWHHDPESAPGHHPEVATVHLANILAVSLGIGLGRDGLLARLDERALERLALTPDQAMALCPALHTAFMRAVDLVQMGTG